MHIVCKRESQLSGQEDPLTLGPGGLNRSSGEPAMANQGGVKQTGPSTESGHCSD
jgi:hypothetical protein